MLPQLTGLFPGTQFVVTTHSPIVVQSAIDSGFAVVRLVEADGEVTAQRLSTRLAKALRGAEVGSVLFEDHIFGIESRFSLEYSKIEQRVDELQAKVSSGEATEADYRELKKGLDKLEELVAKEDRRRADGSTMAQMVRMQGEFVKALTDSWRSHAREKARPHSLSATPRLGGSCGAIVAGPGRVPQAGHCVPEAGINSPKRRKGFAAFAPHVPVPALWGRHKEVIAAMSAHKCAYCEGPINALRASHVEHFKPKSLFPLLAYEWTNYFLGCPGCNGAKSASGPSEAAIFARTEEIRAVISFLRRMVRQIVKGAQRSGPDVD